jgi:hypothetical protein
MNENEKLNAEEEVTIPTQPIAEAEESAQCPQQETPATAAEQVTVEAPQEGAVSDSVADTSVEEPANTVSDDAAQEDVKLYTLSKEQLVEELQAIVNAEDVSAHKKVAAIKQAFYVLKNREVEEEMAAFVEAGNQPEAFSASLDENETKLKDLLSEFKEKRSSFLAAEEARRQENLEMKKKIIEQLRELADDIDNINLHFQKFQQLQQDFKAITDIPASDVADTWKNYQMAVEQFYDRLKMNKELRDLDFKKNLECKRELIEAAKALENEPDVVTAFRKLQELHDKWRETGPVAKELREEIWDEFKAASTVVNKRHQDFFEAKKANEVANEEAKVKLCEEIESIDMDALNSFNEWDKMTKKIIELQGEWKKLGFASRKMNNALFARFRKVCDEFFARKAEYFKTTKETFAQNLAKKIDLCEKAEALKELGDHKKGMEEVVKLQAEWKKVGSVSRKHSDAVWERFTKACNYFFEERKRQNSAIRQEENANLAAKRAIIEALRAINVDELEREDALKQVKELQAQWQTIGHVPFRQKDIIFAEYREVADELYGKLDVRNNRRRMNNFQEQISDISGDDNKLSRERDRLYRQYEAKKTELKTAENNLGFFNVKSSEGNFMVKEMERRIKKIGEEMQMLEEKIALINEKMQ